MSDEVHVFKAHAQGGRTRMYHSDGDCPHIRDSETRTVDPAVLVDCRECKRCAGTAGTGGPDGPSLAQQLRHGELEVDG
jgi:hypothetical protein